MTENSLISYTFSTPDAKYCQTNVRFLDKQRNEHMLEVFENWWDQLISLYGTQVKYYTHGYSLENQNPLFGENTTSEFSDPLDMIMVVSISNDSTILAKFGISSEAEFTAVIPIKQFTETWGDGAEPKAGDLVYLEEWGQGRTGNRDGWVFQISNRKDFDVSQTNQLMGQYVWLLEGKRFDYSYEPNAKLEDGLDQIYDPAFAGLLSGDNIGAVMPPLKKYPQTIEEESIKIFDYSQNPESNTSVFGGY